MNTWKISGMLIVWWPITIMSRTCQETSKPQTNYYCCLWFRFPMPYWLFPRNTITFHLNPQHITLNLCQNSTLQFWIASRICWVQMLPSTVDLLLFRLLCHEIRIEWQWFNLKSPSWLHHSLHQWLCLREIALPHSNHISYWSHSRSSHFFSAVSF